MVQSTLQMDRKPSRSILGMCGRSDRYQNSSIDFTQSELISVSSPHNSTVQESEKWACRLIM